MASVDLIVSAVAAADICLTYGKRLIEAYQDFKNANEKVKAKILVVEAIWSRTAVQVEFVKRVANSLEEEHCRIHLEVFEMLKAKLMMAISKIESVVQSGSGSGVKRWKFVFIHDSINDTISQLELWQRIFDPTWYLILRIGDEVIDKELSTSSLPSISSSSTLVPAQKLRGSIMKSRRQAEADNNVHITLPEDGLIWKDATDIRYSSTRLVPRRAPQVSRFYAVETIECTQIPDISRTRADTESLAKKLSQIESGTFGLLSCYGLIKKKHPESRQLASLHLVFSLPAKSVVLKPTSLRFHLLYSSGLSISRILSTARQLAAAVSYVHTCDFVHKNIRPETILIFPDEEEQTCALGSAYLLGFDSFRNVNFQTMKSGDEAWDRNLYRHPSRQGLSAQNDYVMQHDVYNLGVCLLELGMWQSFVQYMSDDGDQVDGKTLPSDSLGLELRDFDFKRNEEVSASSKIKSHLVQLARTRLPQRMGDKYTSVVLTCLTCLDPGTKDFGDEEMLDDDGVLVGVRFIENVLLKLGDISL